MNVGVITRARIKEVLAYDPDAGIMTWKLAPSNRVTIGVRAGSLTKYGYRSIRVDGANYLEHRLAWLYVTGAWPTNEIDHINGVRDDNRFSNLREATSSENKANTIKRKDNSSGFKGVSWDRSRRMWLVQVNRHGKRQYLARFRTVEEAHSAYCAASLSLHGEFSKTE